MSLKVLICDTDERFVERATQFLAGHGHQVMSEPMPGDALDLASHWKPNVLVLSSELADTQDDQFMSELQNMSPRPAVLLTGQLDRFDAAWRAWRRAGDELLLKPVLQGWELHQAILAAIEAAPANRAATAAGQAVSA
jgi:CheY-like chemotaxis protein